MPIKRYVAVIDLYVYAENDQEAIDLMKARCKEQDQKEDNHCKLIKLVEQPFGELGNRSVYDAHVASHNYQP